MQNGNSPAADKDYILKAADLFTGSLNAVLLIATALLAALVAYGNGRTAGKWQFLFWLALALLVVTGAVAVVTINSLINKIHAGKAEGVRHGEVRKLYVATVVLLAFGILAGALFVNAAQNVAQMTAPQPNTIVSDTQLILGKGETHKVTIIKNGAGKIIRIDIVGP